MKKLLSIVLFFIALNISAQEWGSQLDSVDFKPKIYKNGNIGIGSSGHNPDIKFHVYRLSYLELRKEYKEYCNEIVSDTISEQGFITFESRIKPNTITDVEFVAIDTNWYSGHCKEYKFNSNVYFDTTNVVRGEWRGSTTTLEGNLSWGSNIITPINDKYTSVEISRVKVCYIKRCPETQDGFWEWVEENYLK